MDIRAERQGLVVVVGLDGCLTIEADACPLRELARALRRLDARNLVLDLGGVRQLDSYGVGQLVTLYNELRPSGVAVTLANVERHQKRLLEVAGLLAVFHVADSRQEAVTGNACKPAPQSVTPVDSSCEVTRDAA